MLNAYEINTGKILNDWEEGVKKHVAVIIVVVIVVKRIENPSLIQQQAHAISV